MKKMRHIFSWRSLGIALPLCLLCACATTRNANLPAPITMNQDAGRGGLLMVMVGLESGEKLPFTVDTASPSTMLDKSLEPKLGRRLGTIATDTWTKETKSGVYTSPKLYLGNTPLKMTGTEILTDDLAKLGSDSERDPSLGLLGLDVLMHYCVQLDFNSRKIRFLAANEVDPAKLGKAFSLHFSGETLGPEAHPYIEGPPLAGEGTSKVIMDTGCSVDGSVPPEVFCKLEREKKRLDPASLKLDGSKDAFVEKCVWNGQTYTNLRLINGPNLIGLGFLARHLVTFDFPNRTMYLKQTSTGPLADKELDAAAESALKTLWRLRDKGQLPGWSKNDKLAPDNTDCDTDSVNCITCNLQKEGDPSFYHYEFTREPKKRPWKLRKAWRTDQNDLTLEEYPVPSPAR